MSEALERATRAVCRIYNGDDMCECDFGDCPGPIAAARAAIAAVMPPTGDMLQAGADCLPDMDRAPESYAVAVDDAGSVFEAMIARVLL